MLFRERLKTLREAKSMTQESLASASGVSTGTIRGFEQGLRHPTFAVVQLITKALGENIGVWDGLDIEMTKKMLANTRKPKKPKKDE
ncbi:helix-turn-helix domain-containing protein [Zavarzinella formosa]|uniref:helix-turn-helix domain-containing protein n=1 Tax=Zavarzinella formosa TaxID=360055 RepID=UPI000593738E|nr:helix-turn-helix transcriptional regulator [Zavarzinella formosa]